MSQTRDHHPGSQPVRLEHVAFTYGSADMLFDADFPSSSITAIMGPSGSGKSTLLNLVAGFETPATGRVLIGDRDVTGLVPAERPVSMIFQENNLFAHLDVAKNVGLGRSLRWPVRWSGTGRFCCSTNLSDHSVRRCART